MTIASILILGLVPLAAGDAKGQDSAPVAPHAAGIHADSSLVSRTAHPRPRGSRQAVLFWEQDEEDDSSDDDAPCDPASWRVASHAGTLRAGPLADRGTGRILSRSASPTLRLRC